MIRFDIQRDGAPSDSVVRVGTHNGSFHADEVFATAVLLEALGGLEVARTRDPATLAEQAVLLDVGGVYDPALGRFDHHQKGGAGSRNNGGTPYATAGLAWRHFGESVVRAFDGSLTPEEVAEVHADIDSEFFQYVDAVDCGVDVPGPAATSISSVISGFNPEWYEEPTFDASFEKAVWFARDVVRNRVRETIGKVKARAVVNSGTHLHDGRVLVLDRYVPWEETVCRNHPAVLFVVAPGPTGDWRVRVVPAEFGRFKARKDLPEAWAGLNDVQLSEVSGVADCVFCHCGRFICANLTKQGALDLARIAAEA